MSEIMAAIGRVQLSRFEEFAEKRIILAQNYQKAFNLMKGLKTFNFDYGNVVPHIFVLMIENENRDNIKEFLLSKNIEVGIHYMPNHLLSFFKQNGASFPNAESLYQKVITLPLPHKITEEQQKYIIEKVQESLEI